MRITLQQIGFAALLMAATGLSGGAWAQAVEPGQAPPSAIPLANSAATLNVSPNSPASTTSSGTQALVDFQDSDVRFRLADLMQILRDRTHEGWVLAAYPDPKTGRPLIGAGFSLDLPERAHLQSDPLNPHPFLEPSSAQLWQAAGLEPTRLEQILSDYHSHVAAWGLRRFRRKIALLEPQITDEEATGLLRIAAIQAIENARAYCRSFDQLTASQQMALSQLVYQMGVNLEEFGTFLKLLNADSGTAGIQEVAASDAPRAPDSERWNTVQTALVQSQWAHLYRTRAVSVIAMLDPSYADDPQLAQQRIAATLRPAVSRRRGRHAPALRTASLSRQRPGHPTAHRKTTRRATKV